MMSEDPEVGAFDTYAAADGGEGDWDLSDLTSGPDYDHCASVHVYYDQLRALCSTVSLSFQVYCLSYWPYYA